MANKGFTLLEVMVALVIFSIGLIGLAGMQGLSLQNNQVAYKRTIATQLVTDMADRIRNNPAGAYDGTIPSSAPTTSCVGPAADCNTVALMTDHDLFEWDQTLKLPQNSLTQVRGIINRTASGTGFIIDIAWNETTTTLDTALYDCSTAPPEPPGAECVRNVVEP